MSEEAKNYELEISDEQKNSFESVVSIAIKRTDKYLVPMAREIFGSVFEDLNSVAVKIDANGRFTMSLFFAQTEQAAGGTYAFNFVAKEENASGFRRILALENCVKNGNKFTITDVAKGIFSKFMINEVKDHSGNVDWTKPGIITQQSGTTRAGLPVEFNVINFIDPIKLIKAYTSNLDITAIDEAGNAVVENIDVDYQIQYLATLPTGYPGQFPPEYGPFRVQVTRLNKKALHEAMAEAGWSNIPDFLIKQ